MKKLVLFSALALLIFPVIASAQAKYFTREGTISFYSKTPGEVVAAINKKVTSVIDSETGQIEFSVLMKAFQFEKALMQEHFNENYVESDKYPKAVFKGNIVNKSDVKWAVDGVYPVQITGKMSLHGVTKDLSTEGKLTVIGSKVSGNAEFVILIKDYNIEIPKLVKDKVAESMKVTVDMNYEPFKAN